MPATLVVTVPSLLCDTRLKFSAMHSLPAATPTSAATPTRAAVVARNILMVEVAMQTKLDEPKCCRARCGFPLEKIKQKCFFVVNSPVKILKRNIDQTIEFVRMKNVMNPDTEMLVMLKQ